MLLCQCLYEIRSYLFPLWRVACSSQKSWRKQYPQDKSGVPQKGCRGVMTHQVIILNYEEVIYFHLGKYHLPTAAKKHPSPLQSECVGVVKNSYHQMAAQQLNNKCLFMKAWGTWKSSTSWLNKSESQLFAKTLFQGSKFTRSFDLWTLFRPFSYASSHLHNSISVIPLEKLPSTIPHIPSHKVKKLPSTIPHIPSLKVEKLPLLWRTATCITIWPHNS